MTVIAIQSGGNPALENPWQDDRAIDTSNDIEWISLSYPTPSAPNEFVD
jgi:hypothetical protein